MVLFGFYGVRLLWSCFLQPEESVEIIRGVGERLRLHPVLQIRAGVHCDIAIRIIYRNKPVARCIAVGGEFQIHELLGICFLGWLLESVVGCG